MEDLLDIGKYIYEKCNYPSDKKVQKITYYAYSWYIAMYNSDKNNIVNRLTEEHPEAWVHGPVFNDLFQKMTYEREEFLARDVNLKDDTKKFLNKVIRLYGRYSGNLLEDMTHNELPWKEARGNLLKDERSNKPIKDEVIFSYYKS